MARRTRGFRRLLAAVAFTALSASLSAEGLADRVVLVANSMAPDSEAVALHYAQVRGVPRDNVIVLAMPISETITWRQFVASVWQPLEDELVRRDWIDGIGMDLFDEVGRRKYAFMGHRIAALVLCRGVPLKIENDPELYRELKPLTDFPEFKTNRGSVDSELSLLARTDYPINACVPNPLFHNDRPGDVDRSQVVEVSRLDGPTAADAMGLVDKAVEAERTGLLGRGYIDIAGPHPSGDRWLETTAAEIQNLGYDVTLTRGRETLAASARFDAPALYFGWYAPDMSGPFTLPGFRFPPGAIAVHIHSFSARTLRSTTEGWCGPLVDRGVTATVGNVFEPYLEYTHRPDLLLAALARGNDLVDAAYYSLPVLSWQAVLIGDPLYRPFPNTARVRDPSAIPKALAGYAAIREMTALDAAGQFTKATELGKSAMQETPNLALALALARRLRSSGAIDEAAEIVKTAALSADSEPGNWELVRECALFLAQQKRSAESVELYRYLFSMDGLPALLKRTWRGEARQAALEAGDAGQAAEWNVDSGTSGHSPEGQP